MDYAVCPSDYELMCLVCGHMSSYYPEHVDGCLFYSQILQTQWSTGIPGDMGIKIHPQTFVLKVIFFLVALGPNLRPPYILGYYVTAPLDLFKIF